MSLTEWSSGSSLTDNKNTTISCSIDTSPIKWNSCIDSESDDSTSAALTPSNHVEPPHSISYSESLVGS
jgi:hypothetical protein